MKASDVKKSIEKHILADGFDLVMDIEKSHGSWIVDKRNGKNYLDMFSMFASASIGYNHPHLTKHLDYLGKMAINKPTMSDVYNMQYAKFIDTFSRVAVPKELQYIFFISGGALAVENALKAAFDWKTKKNFSKDLQTEADQVIHFKQAFHGRSGYTLSLTNTADPRKTKYFPKFNWPRIINPKLSFPLTKKRLKKVIEVEKEAIFQINQAIGQWKERIACIIIEPIQAEGGDHHFRKEFFEQLRAICDEKEILFIMDEIQTGLGLTGKMWASEHFVLPDIIVFGKKMHVCGLMADKKRFDEVEKHVFNESARINSTFGGNFIDMVRSQLTLEVYEKEKLAANAAKQGNYLLQKLVHLSEQYSHIIENARGRGLMCAFDLKNAAQRNLFLKKAFAKQMIILPCGERSIRFRPHLNVTKRELDIALQIVERCL